MTFAGTHFFAIGVAAVVAWLFGALWYAVLAKFWLAALGTTMLEFKQRQAVRRGAVSTFGPYVLSFACELIMALALSGIMTHMGNFSLRSGIISGALIWFGFVLTTMAVNNAFSLRKPMLTLIDGGHWLGVLLIMGAIIGVMG